MAHFVSAGAGADRLLLVALLAFTTFTGAPAAAAKVYRCGNVFQDRPCPETKVADERPAERSTDCDAKTRTDCPPKSAPEPRRATTVDVKR